jgi:DNA mismatch repair protein MutS2
LKELAFRRPRAENACTEFDHRTLSPCYRILIGTPGESGALVIARRLGIPGAVVDLAGQRLERRDEELLQLMEEVRHARVAAEDVRNRTEVQLDHARRAAEDARGLTVELQRRGEQLEAEAQRGLEERVREAMRQVEAARKLLVQLPRETAGAMAERLDALELHLSGDALGERRQAFLESLGKGKLVYLPRYKKRVLVHKVDRNKREVMVKLGSMTMRVPFEEVTWYESL